MKKIIPDYAYKLLIIMLLLNCSVYWGNRLISDGLYHYDFTTNIDRQIPLIPVFVIPYFLAYVQWLVAYIMISRDSKELCNYIFKAEIITKIIAFIMFIIIPTTMVRPTVTGSGFFSYMLNYLYKVDAPVSLLPSIHCIESWFCMRGFWKIESIDRKYKYLMTFISITIFCAVLFVKQHVIADVIAAFIVAELGLLIMRMYYRLKGTVSRGNG